MMKRAQAGAGEDNGSQLCSNYCPAYIRGGRRRYRPIRKHPISGLLLTIALPLSLDTLITSRPAVLASQHGRYDPLLIPPLRPRTLLCAQLERACPVSESALAERPLRAPRRLL